MEHTFSMDEARLVRLRSQRLHSATTAPTVRDAIAGICGIQAQDQQAAALAVRVRSHDTTASDVETALFDDRSIVRTWCMRGSLHLLATTDLPWLLSLFGPVFVARSKRRLSDLGFDDEACEQAMQEIESSLADHGPLTRNEIGTSLQQAGIDIDLNSQAPYHLIRRAALLGIIIEAPPKDGDEAYDLLHNWVSLDEPPDRETALRKLARRYLAAYQPATVDDFAAWSKLPMNDVRKGWELLNSETTTGRIDGRTMTMFADDVANELSSDSLTLRLLPAYDTYLLGYDSRTHAVSTEYGSRVWPGGGYIRPVVTLNGRAIATWKLDRSCKTPSILINSFDRFDSALEPKLGAEIDDVSRFLDSNITYRFAD